MASIDNDGVWRPVASFDKNKVQWPQEYSLRLPPEGAKPRKYWHHTYYRGPKDQRVQILYSSDRQQSEGIAQGFLNEPVLGFDMEWPWDSGNHTRLREKVALIQIACARKIALFHIGLHDGDTTEELIAPTLRRIIESPKIIKTGVAVMSVDFARLKNCFEITPRGAFELSHLHNLVTFGSQNPELVTTKLRALSKITKDHFRLPLNKGPVRTSDWSLPLDEEQKQYAADDAYVAYMLFHCMNALRLGMTPVPPLPKLSESYLPFTFPEIFPIQLESVAEGPDAVVLTAKDFFTPSKPIQAEGRNEKTDLYNVHKPQEPRLKAKQVEKLTVDAPEEPEISQELYKKLAMHRTQQARSEGVAPYVIAHNKALEGLARYRPANKTELLEINGIGEKKVSLYGDDWLEIISQDLKKHPKEPPKETPKKPHLPLKEKTSNKVIASRKNDFQKSPGPELPDSHKDLYLRLCEHRQTQATTRGCRLYQVATNFVLETLAQEIPKDMQELRAIEGMENSQVNAYGPAWLRIIAEFKADQQKKPVQTYQNNFFQQPQQPPAQRQDQPPAPKRIKHVGRSREILDQSVAESSTGSSFGIRHVSLDVDEAPAQRNDSVCYDEPGRSVSKSPIRSSPRLKRKRAECSTDTATPSTLSKAPVPLSKKVATGPESLSPQ